MYALLHTNLKLMKSLGVKLTLQTCCCILIIFRALDGVKDCCKNIAAKKDQISQQYYVTTMSNSIIKTSGLQTSLNIFSIL